MKQLRRLLSLLLVASAFASVSACTSITGWDDCGVPGTNNNPCE